MIDLHRIAIEGFVAGSDRLLDCDIHEDGRVASLVERAGEKRLVVAGAGWDGLPPDARARVTSARWLTRAELVVGPVVKLTDAAVQTRAAVSASGFTVLPFGAPHIMFATETYAFATYGERVLLFTREPSYENDVVTVFDAGSLARLFGLADIMRRGRNDPSCHEVTSGCATRDGAFVFVGLGSSHVWTLDPLERSCRTVEASGAMASPEDVAALSVSGRTAILMLAVERAIELRWVDLVSGSTLHRELVAEDVVREAVGGSASPAPGGGFRLDAAARGLDMGRFILRTADRAVLLSTRLEPWVTG